MYRQLFALSLIISSIGSLQAATSESFHGGGHCDISKKLEGSEASDTKCTKCAGLFGNSSEKSENGDRIVSGLEFLRDEYNIVSDVKTYTDPDYFERQQDETNFSLLEHVRKFIRTVKGLPPDKLPDENIGSGEDMESKPAWCYYPYRLANLVKIEIKIYELFKEFSRGRKDGDVFPVFDSYMRDIEESSLRVLNNPEFFLTKGSAEVDPYLYIATHPLLIYRIIRRFAEDLQPILTFFSDNNAKDDLIASIYDKANVDLVVFPNSEDLTDALTSLSRIQHGSEIKTHEFVKGILERADTHLQLNSLHALEVGAYYFDEGDFDFAVEWIHAGLELVRKSPQLKTHPLKDTISRFFEAAMEFSIDEHNRNWEILSKDEWHPNVFTTIITKPFQPDLYTRTFEITRQSAREGENRTKESWNWAIKANFVSVCSGKNLLPEAEKAKLKCWYQTANDLYWLINPLKVEGLSLDPPVVQIYEFIGDEMGKKIKAAAVESLRRSTVVDRSHPSNSVVDPTRTSSQTWLYDNLVGGEFLKKLTRRMELLSHLVISPSQASDAFQVAAYGPSHHYDTHTDAFEDSQRTEQKGNRITTIMGYLTDVAVGGRTGFPVLGAYADPIKGSIVVWNNLRRNGLDSDMRTWHGGCPVVLGVKWITNKWVLSQILASRTPNVEYPRFDLRLGIGDC